MKRKCFVLFYCLPLLVTAFNISGFGQSRLGNEKTRPNFSGIWVMDEDSSNSRGRQSWVISFINDEFKLNKTIIYGDKVFNEHLTLYTDKRGEINKILSYGNRDLRSKTRFRDNTVIREFSRMTGKTGDAKANISTVIESYSLSKDGNRLIFIVSEPELRQITTSGGIASIERNNERRVTFRRKI